jgi:GTP cyclohydrolase I
VTDRLEEIFTKLLAEIDPDPWREGIKETPARAAKAWREWTAGYAIDPTGLLKSFGDGAEQYDGLVIVSNIPVRSHCEHHLADIIGIAHVGYVPNGKVVGLSKLARVVDAFSRRLQVQERLTSQVADCIMDGLNAKGVGVLVRAAHHCMSTRGVKIHGSVTTTCTLRGVLFDKPEARAEFLSLCRDAEHHDPA